MTHNISTAILALLAATSLAIAPEVKAADVAIAPKSDIVASGGKDLLAQAGITYSTISVRNNTNYTISVRLHYQDDNQGWVTKYFTFAPGERGYLADTTNRYFYISATNYFKRGAYPTWVRTRVNMGGRFVRFTYNLNP